MRIDYNIISGLSTLRADPLRRSFSEASRRVLPKFIYYVNIIS